MSKLYFRFGAMNCGKTTALIQVAHNYKENNKNVIIIKPSIDTKGGERIDSRIGVQHDVDILIKPDESFEGYFDNWNNNVDCILVDEAQFLSPSQVEELWTCTKLFEIPVICYGLKTNFKSELFDGSKRLIELADSIEEMPTICECGKKARYNARFVNGYFAKSGDSVVIDGSKDNVEYRPLCGKCFLYNRKYN